MSIHGFLESALLFTTLNRIAPSRLHPVFDKTPTKHHFNDNKLQHNNTTVNKRIPVDS